jgi:hypothetical protein
MSRQILGIVTHEPPLEVIEQSDSGYQNKSGLMATFSRIYIAA